MFERAKVRLGSVLRRWRHFPLSHRCVNLKFEFFCRNRISYFLLYLIITIAEVIYYKKFENCDTND